jgi:hypothetical protein
MKRRKCSGALKSSCPLMQGVSSLSRLSFLFIYCRTFQWHSKVFCLLVMTCNIRHEFRSAGNHRDAACESPVEPELGECIIWKDNVGGSRVRGFSSDEIQSGALGGKHPVAIWIRLSICMKAAEPKKALSI